MTDNRRSNRNYDRPAVYEIIIQGHLSNQWSHWFDGFMITLDERGRTILVGLITDQAALHGLLKKIRDLGVPLISVKRLDPDDTTN